MVFIVLFIFDFGDRYDVYFRARLDTFEDSSVLLGNVYI